MKRTERDLERGDDQPLVLTIGHSTRTIEEFIQLLKENEVARLVDVRTIPKSRFNPQYEKNALAAALEEAGIGYTHMAPLGGLRHASRASVNTAWRNASFRGYADYMQTQEFREGLEKLIHMARKERVAIMCSEAVPWRCHRSLIEDALLVRGIRCEDIIGDAPRKLHELTSFARVEGMKITYPGEQMEMTMEFPADQ